MRLTDSFTFLPLVANCPVSIEIWSRLMVFQNHLNLPVGNQLCYSFFPFPPFGKPRYMTHCTIVF